MSYGLLGIKSELEGEAMQGLSDLAGQQHRAEILEGQMEQAQHAQRMQAVGMGAGVGMMAGMQAGSVGGPMGALIGAGVGLLASELF